MDMEHFLTSVYLAKIHYLQIDYIYMYQEARLQQNYNIMTMRNNKGSTQFMTQSILPPLHPNQLKLPKSTKMKLGKLKKSFWEE